MSKHNHLPTIPLRLLRTAYCRTMLAIDPASKPVLGYDEGERTAVYGDLLVVLFGNHAIAMRAVRDWFTDRNADRNQAMRKRRLFVRRFRATARELLARHRQGT